MVEEALIDLGSLMFVKKMRSQRNRDQVVVLNRQTISIMTNLVEGRSRKFCLTHTEL